MRSIFIAAVAAFTLAVPALAEPAELSKYALPALANEFAASWLLVAQSGKPITAANLSQARDAVTYAHGFCDGTFGSSEPVVTNHKDKQRSAHALWLIGKNDCVGEKAEQVLREQGPEGFHVFPRYGQ